MITDKIIIKELEEKKLELRAYEITIPSQNANVRTSGLQTDIEHKAVWGAFIHDENYNGLAENFDMKSRITLDIDATTVWDNVHANLFLSNPTIPVDDLAWKFHVPVAQSRIAVNYVDGAHFDAAKYPRKVTLYLIVEKK